MLRGIKVLEFEGLAPSVFLGMILADYGADCLIISRKNGNITPNIMNRGKQSMTFDLKDKQDISQIKLLIKESHILLDPYRPGVLERVGLSYELCHQINPKLIFARISAFGQNSPLKHMAGHDINFISYSGLLSLCASTGNSKWPAIPGNMLGDFAAGGAMGAASILAALINVMKGGDGQELDIGMAQTSAYLSQFIMQQKSQGLWNNGRGQNILDGGAHFYNVYQCKDLRFYSVGCIEDKFYQEYLKGLVKGGLSQSRAEYFYKNHLNMTEWGALIQETKELFIKKTRDEWENIFKDLDCCASPVVELEELEFRTELGGLIWKRNGSIEVIPQPRFSGMIFEQKEIPTLGQHNHLKPKAKL